MDEALAAALAPPFQDLALTCPVPATVVDEHWSDFGPSAMLQSPDGSGMGVWVDASRSFAEQVVQGADQVQEWAVEALWGIGLPAVWPECDLHPDTHPLKATVVEGVAMWVCPVTDTWEIPIGALDPSV